MTKVAQDALGNNIQALELKEDGAHKISFTDSSARNTVAFDAKTRVVFVSADQDCYIKQGDNAVAADNTDHFLPAGTYVGISIGGRTGHKTHIAAIQASAAGTLYISETA